MKKLSELTRKQFELLKITGFLFEFYPDAPDDYDDIPIETPSFGWWD